MKSEKTPLNDVLVIMPKVFGDTRGFFYESFNHKQFDVLIGKNIEFVQDNHAKSSRGVLRGLHYQIQQPQGKLVRVVEGEVFDVVVDLRRSSSTFGKWFGLTLNAENKKMLWVPAGFAHGYLTLSETAEFLYKTTDYYHPESERCIAWNDPVLKIDWNLKFEPLLSEKDKKGLSFQSSETYP